VGDGNRAEARRSLVSAWLEQSAHPLVALVVVLVLEAAALGGLVWWAGWHGILQALSAENAEWFALCAGGQIVAYFGYTLALRGIAAADDGVRLDLAASFGIVSVGFAPIFSANSGGGFSIDAVTLREAGMTRRRAFRRVLALSALEYAVLAPAVAMCGLLLFLHIGGKASAGVALPWLAVVPGTIVAVLLTSPRHANWSRVPHGSGWMRRCFAHGVAALTVLRNLVVVSERQWTAFAGAALYWLGDMATLWAALRVFDVRLSVPVLVLAYGTGWALTRRSLPFGGPGMVEVLLAWVLTWFHVPFAPAAAGVVAYRLFNFWLALIPAAIVIPFAQRLQRKLVREAASS
jgi:uncharacterized membrane protein YbhN (UPF0104 family)